MTYLNIEVCGVSADRWPIVDRRSVDNKPFAKSQRQSADREKKWSVFFLQQFDPKKQLKSHTKSADCRSTVGRFTSLTVDRLSVG